MAFIGELVFTFDMRLFFCKNFMLYLKHVESCGVVIPEFRRQEQKDTDF